MLGESEPVDTMSEIICKGKLVSDITFENTQPLIVGSNVVEKEEKLENICLRSDTQKALALPNYWNFHDAVHICKILGNSQIFSLPNPENLTEFDPSFTFGEKNTHMLYIWTPYSDYEEDGVFKHIYTNKILNLDWGSNQPNGGTAQNYVNFRANDKKLNDCAVHGDGNTNLACSLPKRRFFLRGGCKKTLIGNNQSYILFLI